MPTRIKSISNYKYSQRVQANLVQFAPSPVATRGLFENSEEELTTSNSLSLLSEF